MTHLTERLAPELGDADLTADEIETFERDALFEEPGALTSDDYPRARTWCSPTSLRSWTSASGRS
jgi:hypothetical protein